MFVADAIACHPTANPNPLATSPMEAEKAKLSFQSPLQQGGGGTALAHDIEEVEVCGVSGKPSALMQLSLPLSLNRRRSACEMTEAGRRVEGEGAPGGRACLPIAPSLQGSGEHGHHLGARTGKEVLGC